MNDGSVLLVPDQVLAQQCLVALVLLAVGLMCVFRLRSGAYAPFAAVGGLVGGAAATVRAAESLEVRFRSTQALFDYVQKHDTFDNALDWAFVVGIVLVAFAAVSDRAWS
jgi:hypothetical protein